MDTYTNKIMYDRISWYINHSAPFCVNSSLLRLLRLLWNTPEYLRELRELRYSEIWDNAIVRGRNT